MKRTLLIFALFALIAAPVFSQVDRYLKLRTDQVEDTGHTTGDYLTIVGAVRDDSPIGSLCGTTNDYCPLQVDDTGNLYVIDSSGAAIVVDLAAIEVLLTAANVDHAANEALLITIDTDTGALVTDLAALEVLSTAANVDLAAIEVTQDALVVDLAAIEVTQDALVVDAAAMEALLITMDVDTDAMATDLAAIELTQDAIVTDIAANEALLITIDVDTSALFGTVAGSEQQVDIVTTAQPTPVGSIVCGQTDVPGAGTSVNLAANACATGVTIGCELLSTGDCYVGHATGDNRANGMSLPDGGPNVFLPVSNTNLLWVDVTTGGDDVGWCCY